MPELREDYISKYEFMYLDFIDNYVCEEYFAICYNVRRRQAEHILNTGALILFRKFHLN